MPYATTFDSTKEYMGRLTLMDASIWEFETKDQARLCIPKGETISIGIHRPSEQSGHIYTLYCYPVISDSVPDGWDVKNVVLDR